MPTTLLGDRVFQRQGSLFDGGHLIRKNEPGMGVGRRAAHREDRAHQREARGLARPAHRMSPAPPLQGAEHLTRDSAIRVPHGPSPRRPMMTEG